MHDLPLLKKMFDQFHEAIYIVDKERKILYFNPVSEQISGFSKGEMEYSYCHDNRLNHMDDHGNNLCVNGCPLLKSIEQDIVQDHYVYMHHKDGHRVRVHVRTIPHHTPEGIVDGAIEVYSDVTPKNLMLQELKVRKALSYIDPLTEVFNRHFLTHELETLLVAHTAQSIGVLFFDVDSFKTINDTYGHAFGDAVLQGVARSVAGNVKEQDIVIRYGGDEFVVLLIGLDASDLTLVLERLMVVFKGTVIRRGPIEHPVLVSLGATMRKDDEPIETTIERADQAMYTAKKSGKNHYRIR
jgi:diguanylate cyclase (GGDEF)-like protein/PAS domain S-box-containing protein